MPSAPRHPGLEDRRFRAFGVGALLRLAALVLGLAAALALPSVARSQEGPAEPPEPLGGVGGGVSGYDIWDWFMLGGRLALVLVVIWLAVVAMRWWMRRMNGELGGSARQLQVIETRALGPNRALHLVRLGGRAVLIGVTPPRITQLMEIDDPSEVERLAHVPDPPEQRSLRSLAGGMTSLFSRGAAAGPRQGGPGARAEALEGRVAREAAEGTVRDSLGALLSALSGERPAPSGAGRVARPGTADDVEPANVRALRARAGYRQNQIAEIQRAIAEMRRDGLR